jgi:acetylornithine/succinyldiaminopimelate/putrescine aminotransferase
MEVRAAAADALADFAPGDLNHVFFTNSGAESNENALRIACKLTGRNRIVAIEHGFHGRTAAAGAVTWGARKKWYGFPQAPFEVDFLPRDNAGAVPSVVTNETAAVILELVQGLGGAYDLDPGFVRTIARACQAMGALLIIDEVQTGIGRCGEPFATNIYKVAPDMITVAKSVAGGIPCGALIVTDDVAASIGPGDLGSTFGGGPLASVMVSTVIGVIREEKLMDNIRSLSGQIAQACPVGPVDSVQGKGFLRGLKLRRSAVEVRNELLERDILVGTSTDPHVVRLLPPYILETKHVQSLLGALAELPEE